MYDFHYDSIKNNYDNKSKILFTDADSLMYEIKVEDINEDFISDKESLTLVIIRLSQNTMMIHRN